MTDCGDDVLHGRISVYFIGHYWLREIMICCNLSTTTTMLEIRREITKGWFGHEGLYFRENICPTGGERDTQPTSGRLPDASRPSKRGAGATSEWLHEFYFYSSLELIIMMVEYSEYTTDEYFTQRYLLPMAREVLKFYDRHYDRDDNGKLRLDPAAVLETFSRAVNPATDVSALRRVLGDLISHNIGSDKDMAYWKRLLSEVPEIPMQKTPEGKVAIAPAEIYSKKVNTENGELYPVFPAMLYGVAQGTQDIVENTMEVRVEKDSRGGVCWTQDQIDWAFAGNAEEARFGLERRFRVASTQCRFPLFGKEEPDSCPDFDHFGSGSIALQKMLIQEDGEKIFLFPAWPAKWDVDFKLHAHNNTVIEGVVKDGKVVEWSITPKYRAKDQGKRTKKNS